MLSWICSEYAEEIEISKSVMPGRDLCSANAKRRLEVLAVLHLAGARRRIVCLPDASPLLQRFLPPEGSPLQKSHRLCWITSARHNQCGVTYSRFTQSGFGYKYIELSD